MKPDIIIGTETWLDPSIQDTEFMPDRFNYRVYRKDRKRDGGGVLIAVRSNIDSMEVPELSTDCEIIWAKIQLIGKKSLYVCSYYRPNVSDRESLTQWELSVTQAARIPNALLLIGGDLNFPGWDWPSMTLKPKAPYPDLHNRLVEIIHDQGLEQVVMKPTRQNNTLDLLLTNNPQLIPQVETIPGLSDHCIVYAEFNIAPPRKKPVERTVILYNKADWDSLKQAIVGVGEEVERKKETASTEELWLIFKTGLLQAAKTFIPHKTSRPKACLPWMTPELRRLINKKNRVYKKWRKAGTEELKQELRQCKREAQRRLRRAYWNYINSTLTAEPSDHAPKFKRFWTYIKNQKTSNTGVAPLKVNGTLLTEPKAKAEALNNQFQSVFSEGKNYTRDEFREKCGMDDKNYPVLDTLTISEEGIRRLLAGLDPSKACGPDSITARTLKELSSEIAPILTIIYQSSVDTSCVPSDWRDALVSPIFKKGEHYDPSNYRPVSLTCIACKVLEHIVVSTVMNHLEQNNVLCSQQHGFRAKRSCETQLLEFVEELTESMEAGRQTDILIMDFAKAFDKVNHSLLLHKLTNYGLRGSINSWIAGFLTNRRQAVVLEGVQSDFVSVRSGVPQGSVLGPCLFLIYINDLPENLSSKTRLFADDTAVYRVIFSEEDHAYLQQDLQRLEQWEKKWDMQFHPGKCNSLLVTRNRRPSDHAYQLHGHTLAIVQSAKYLGVTLQGNISWEGHINTITAKASRTLGFLRRNLKVASTELREKAYTAFVRPLLEYASSVWDPYTQRSIEKLESIQRRAARFVLNRYHRTASVSDMLNRLGWRSLQQRRQVNRLTMLYKIHNGIVSIDRSRLVPQPQRQRRGHDQLFLVPQCRTQYRQNAFFPRTIREWNNLPPKAVEGKTPESFASEAHRYLNSLTPRLSE